MRKHPRGVIKSKDLMLQTLAMGKWQGSVVMVKNMAQVFETNNRLV